MASPTDTPNCTVRTYYHSFLLSDIRRRPQPPLHSNNGLIAVQTGAAAIYTGIHTGVVNVGVQPRTEAPADVDTAGWDEVVEVSMQVPTGELIVASMFASPPDLPVLSVAGPGSYRIRLHARGRDTDIDGTASEPFEDYLIIAWPADSGPETAYKQTDRYGAAQREADRRRQHLPQPPAQHTAQSPRSSGIRSEPPVTWHIVPGDHPKER